MSCDVFDDHCDMDVVSAMRFVTPGDSSAFQSTRTQVPEASPIVGVNTKFGTHTIDGGPSYIYRDHERL